MKLVAWVAAVLCVMVMCSAPYPAGAAGKYDGSAPLLCAAMSVTECEADGRCQRRSAEHVNLPSLFRVDAKGMKVRNLEAETASWSSAAPTASAGGSS